MNITFYYLIILYDITSYFYFTTYLWALFKGSNCQVKLERSRLWQLDNPRRKATPKTITYVMHYLALHH